MPHLGLEQLRERLGSLEQTKRRFSRIISIADEIDCRLPFGGLPQGCIHEVKGSNLASVLTFSTILSARIAGSEGNVIYISQGRSLHPPGLLPYGMRLEQFLIVSVRRQRDLPWAVMEALRCPQVSAVLTVLEGIDLTDSRRLQLAAENSGATGFLLGRPTSAPIAAPITRWRVSPQTGKPEQRFDEPAWKIELLYCRGGQPGSWMLEWRNHQLSASASSLVVPVRREALAG